jgi:hypothetical protein
LNANNQPLLAVLPEGALGPGSGRVVLAADSDIYTENLNLIFNTVGYLVPEPSTIVLAGIGAIGLLAAVLRIPARGRGRYSRPPPNC